MNNKPTPPKRTKKSYQIQFYPDVHKAGVDKAKERHPSFQAYLEYLIKADLANG